MPASTAPPQSIVAFREGPRRETSSSAVTAPGTPPTRPTSSLLKNVARMARCKAHGAQRPRHIKQIGEGASTAQRRRWPTAVVFQQAAWGCPRRPTWCACSTPPPSTAAAKRIGYYPPGVGADGSWWNRVVGGGAGVGPGRSVMSAYHAQPGMAGRGGAARDHRPRRGDTRGFECPGPAARMAVLGARPQRRHPLHPPAASPAHLRQSERRRQPPRLGRANALTAKTGMNRPPRSLFSVPVLLAATLLLGCAVMKPAAPSEALSPRDPWEPYNRVMYGFNRTLDKALRPRCPTTNSSSKTADNRPSQDRLSPPAP